MRWSFEKLGQTIADGVETTPGAASEARTRRRILLAASGGTLSAVRRNRILGAALAASLAAAAVFGLHRPSEPEPVVFRVGDAGALGRIGAYYSADSSRRLALRFSDDSAVTLEPEASARVARTTPTGAQVSVESGAVEVQVIHRPDTSWQIAAGPYSLHVTGTSFRVEWQPLTRTVDVAMHEGTVRVTGPGIPSEVLVRGTGHFTTRDRTPAAAPLAPADLPAPASTVANTPAPSASSGTAPRSDHDADAPAAWSTLAAKGRYAEIVRAAERSGLDSVLTRSDRSTLASLADAARFTGRGDLARRALQTVRERFAGSEAAADAAFVLGRMDDEAGAVSSAFAWYDRYLAEAPAGHFAPEALGRKMLALRKLGDLVGSTRIARQYLEKFPDGPYASVARQISTP
jgi:hypothetical protein